LLRVLVAAAITTTGVFCAAMSAAVPEHDDVQAVCGDVPPPVHVDTTIYAS
jgi:hypothetical protein